MNQLQQLLQQLRNLDPNEPGRWPIGVRIAFVALLFLFAASAGYYYFVWKAQRPLLLEERAKEVQLFESLTVKAKRAANLEAYRVQLAEMEKSFGAMLRQLPNKTEVPNLLVDISQTGLAAGLEEKLFQPQGESAQRFLRRAADQHPPDGRLSFDGQVRERHRGTAPHRHPARHRNHSGAGPRGGRRQQPDAERDGQDLSLHRRRRAGGGRRCQARRRGRGLIMLNRKSTVLRATRIALCAATMAMLAGCGNDMDELQAKVEQVKSAPGSGIEPLPEVKPYETYDYAAADQRSPFEAGIPASANAPNAIRPDSSRPREFLEQFSLDTLRMVGTVRLRGKLFGLLQTQDGLVHRVLPGNHVGQADGRITAVEEGKISLIEIVPDGMGGFIERPAALALSE